MTAFRDDPAPGQEREWDSMFFSTHPHAKYRIETALPADLRLVDIPADHICMRLTKFNCCRDYRGNRRCASLIRLIGTGVVGVYNAFSDADLDLLWNAWLIEGAEIEVSPPLPTGLVTRRGRGWFGQEKT